VGHRDDPQVRLSSAEVMSTALVAVAFFAGNYHYEDLLKEVGLHLKAQCKKRSKRPMPVWEEFLSKPIRQYIQTVFRNLRALFTRKIHAITPRGFELKIVWMQQHHRPARAQ
jgi:hypothetical protein